jgi:hypothetical protein
VLKFKALSTSGRGCWIDFGALPVKPHPFPDKPLPPSGVRPTLRQVWVQPSVPLREDMLTEVKLLMLADTIGCFWFESELSRIP